MASVAKRRWTYNGVEKEAWVVRYFDVDKARRSKQFDLKKQADAFARKVERELEDGIHISDAQTLTIERASGEYLRYCEQRVADGRIGRTRLQLLEYSFSRCINPVVGKVLIRDLRESHVEDLYRSLMAADRMKPHSARNRIQDLRLLETFALRRGYLKAQPVTLALKEMHGLSRVPIRTFRPDQVVHLLKTAGRRDHRRQHRTVAYMDAFAHLAALCGLRRGEIMGLTIGHVLFDSRTIRVRHNLTALRELKGPKTRAGVRDVPLPDLVGEKLRHWIDLHYVENEMGLLFTGDDGHPYGPANIRDTWIQLLKRADLLDEGEVFHFHALRHFYASMLIHSGAPLTDTAKLMGHSAFDMTLQVYAHSVLKPEERHHLVDTMVTRMPGLTDARLPQPA